ncbi:MAG TPA: sigma-70 family RNA polymerase sigma factor [Flavobacteriales bacterium]|nr:sigma-70 family RNA polymerase sigma factor [Flavobacteriales bacterium]HIN40037.1 sigma-70 family RNA polymerase sigma factor [Flavobacteriales bacterium]
MLFTSKTNDLPDGKLIEKFLKTNDRHYFGILFQRYTHLVFGACMKYLKNENDSEDAVMDIFEKLLTDLQKHEVSNFKSWLYSVSKNHCLMKLRKDKTIKYSNNDLIKTEGQIVEMPEPMHLNSKMEKELQLENLEKALQHLSKEQRTCLELFYLQQKCYKEVSSITTFSLKEVKSFIQNGKRNLKNHMITNNG